MARTRTRRDGFRQAIIIQIVAGAVGMFVIVFGIVAQQWFILGIGAALVILPIVMTIVFVRARNRQSDAELDRPLP